MSLIPQLGFGELLLLAVLALVVVGPKDLPRLMRGLGRAAAQVRRLSDEFRASFDQMAREAEVEELRREIEDLKTANPVREVRAAVEGARDDAMTALADAETDAGTGGGTNANRLGGERVNGAPEER